MAKLGSTIYQLNALCQEAQIFRPGESRHEAKAEAMERLGTGESAKVNAEIDLYGKNSFNSYKDTWKDLANYAKEEFNIKDVSQINGEIAKSFLEKRADELGKYSSWKQEAAAIAKFDRVLYQSRGIDSGIKETIHDKEWRSITTQDMDRKNSTGNGFSNPREVIENIKNFDYNISARLQFEGGARLEGATQGVLEMKGYGERPGTGERVGVVYVVEKGGYKRDIYVSPQTYKDLEQRISVRGEFKVSDDGYAHAVRDAAKQACEIDRGTHNFRFNYIKDRVQEFGKTHTYEQTLQQISFEVGHNRADITQFYIQK